MSRPHPALLRLARLLIGAGVILALLAFTARAAHARDFALRTLEGGALLLTAAAYLSHLFSHRPSRRELVLRSGLAAAFVLWAIVQIEPDYEPPHSNMAPERRLAASPIEVMTVRSRLQVQLRMVSGIWRHLIDAR